jgi:hypothetical protein
MRRTLAISILLICILNIPWQISRSGAYNRYVNYRNLNSATNASPTTPPSMDQNPTLTVVSPTEKPIKTPHVTPTRTPRPTAPPPAIPPPTDRRLLDSMILFGVIASLTIIFGLWTNRQHINPR